MQRMSDSKEKAIKIAILSIGAIIILNIMDALLTLYGLKLGVVQEANPIIKKTLTSPTLFYSIKIIFPTIFFSLTILNTKRKAVLEKITDIEAQTIKKISIIGMLIYFFINAWTVTTLLIIHIYGNT